MAAADWFDACVAGAGVVGLAVAFRLSASPRFRGREIVLLERSPGFGSQTSSRHSEVVHAGIHYPEGSLKAELCVRGRRLLYEHCRRWDVPFDVPGKIIAAQKGEEDRLEAVAGRAARNGVDDLERLAPGRLKALEPAVRAEGALLSPSTGVVDGRAFMRSLLHQAQARGVLFAPDSAVTAVEPEPSGFAVAAATGDGREEYRFRCGAFVNSAGLSAQDLARRIAGLAPGGVPPLHRCKGDYFSFSGANPFRRLVYPVPEAGAPGLGIHSSMDLAGGLRFGPDSEYVDRDDYRVDPAKAVPFARAVGRYFPAVRPERLRPAWAGIRPKLSGPGEKPADFVIQGAETHGLDGLVQLFGIESPGFTASLAIGERVAGMLQGC